MQEDNEIIGECVKGAIAFFIGLLLLLLTCFLFGGCTRKVYVPVERVRTEYRQADTTAIYKTLLRLRESRRERHIQSDSLIDRERETVVINGQGDTTRHDKERIIYKATAREKEFEVENKMLRDSLWVLNSRLESIKADSVPSIVPVERKLGKWEKAKMDLGGVAFGFLAAVLVVAIIWIMGIRKGLKA